MVLVEDGLTDGVLTHSLNGAATWPEIQTTVVGHLNRRGQGEALATGLEAAAGELVCTINGNGAFLPEALPPMIDRLLANDADIVVGSTLHPDGADGSLVGATDDRLFGRLYAALTPCRLGGYSGFCRVYRRSWARADLFRRGPVAATELLVRAARMGARIVEFRIEIERCDRPPTTPWPRRALGHLRLAGELFWSNLSVGAGGGASVVLAPPPAPIEIARAPLERAREIDPDLGAWVTLGRLTGEEIEGAWDARRAESIERPKRRSGKLKTPK